MEQRLGERHLVAIAELQHVVLAHDAPGLLYGVAKAIFDAGLSVKAAKIGTHLDQVVDAFHVVDRAGGKVTDPTVLLAVRRAIEAVVAPVTAPG